jgi:hypothetical protein
MSAKLREAEILFQRKFDFFMQKQSKFVSFLLLDVFETYWVFSFWVMDHF